jgi:nitrite reductase/ring-hydroxylating ferredoxin subunit
MAPCVSPCPLADADPTCASGVTNEDAFGRRATVVVQHGGGARAYVNRCPHQGAPLEITRGRFLVGARRTIIRSTHGARFRLSDGYCYSGPCRRQLLEPVAVAVGEGKVSRAGQRARRPLYDQTSSCRPRAGPI